MRPTAGLWYTTLKMRREMQEKNEAWVASRVPVSLSERLKAEAHQRDRTVSYLVREALLERYAEPRGEAA